MFILQFGHGKLLVSTGTVDGTPAVIIRRNTGDPAEIGQPFTGDRSAHPRISVWTFPTVEQAEAVARSLRNDLD